MLVGILNRNLKQENAFEGILFSSLQLRQQSFRKVYQPLNHQRVRRSETGALNSKLAGRAAAYQKLSRSTGCEHRIKQDADINWLCHR